MATFNVADIAEARKAQAKINNEKINLNTSKKMLEETFSTMEANGWKGNSSTKFYSDYENYHEQLENLLAQLDDITVNAEKVIQGAQALLETEEQGA